MLPIVDAARLAALFRARRGPRARRGGRRRVDDRSRRARPRDHGVDPLRRHVRRAARRDRHRRLPRHARRVDRQPRAAPGRAGAARYSIEWPEGRARTESTLEVRSDEAAFDVTIRLRVWDGDERDRRPRVADDAPALTRRNSVAPCRSPPIYDRRTHTGGDGSTTWGGCPTSRRETADAACEA